MCCGDSKPAPVAVADLQSLPACVALLCRWADLNQRVPVACDDGTVVVTRSALEMMETLCKGPDPFWVDSLCINQQGILERNQQVAVMADIYSKAALVIVWLSPDPHNDANTLFGSFKELVDRLPTWHALEGKIDFLERDNANLHWTLPNGDAVVSTLPSSIISRDESERQRLASQIASGNRDAVVSPSAPDDLDRLTVRGQIVSRVTCTSSLCHLSSFVCKPSSAAEFLTSSNAVRDTWIQEDLNLLAAQGMSYPRTVQVVTANGLALLGPAYDILTAYLRTWVAGKGRSEADAFDFERDANAYWDRLWATAGSDAANPPSKDTLIRAERFRASAAGVANPRKIFGVKKGLSGLGPGAMTTGDWVTVLLGGDVAFVLREVGGEWRPAGDGFPDDVKFQLVGECSVDGHIMTGADVRGVEVKRDIVLV
ncbi:MAG: hypothetical protein Q9182_006620 [Xanthomendoza sp. 2 TL-2023]